MNAAGDTEETESFFPKTLVHFDRAKKEKNRFFTRFIF